MHTNGHNLAMTEPFVALTYPSFHSSLSTVRPRVSCFFLVPTTAKNKAKKL